MKFRFQIFCMEVLIYFLELISVLEDVEGGVPVLLDALLHFHNNAEIFEDISKMIVKCDSM